jgi:hypothetical protein
MAWRVQRNAVSSKPGLQVRAACFAALAAMTTGSAPPAYAQVQSPVAIRAAYIPVVTWLPVWVAKEKGFFAAHGLDVTLSVSQNLSTLPGTVGKQFDFAPSTGPDLLKSVAAGLDVVAVASEVFARSPRSQARLPVRSRARYAIQPASQTRSRWWRRRSSMRRTIRPERPPGVSVSVAPCGISRALNVRDKKKESCGMHDS